MTGETVELWRGQPQWRRATNRACAILRACDRSFTQEAERIGDRLQQVGAKRDGPKNVKRYG